MPAPASLSPSLPSLSLPLFEGPLDVLLHYVREHKIAIEDIPIVQVTDYYLAYLRALEAMNLAVAGEFLVMAATLLELKSRMLLPRPPREEILEEDSGEDPRAQLVQRLLDYQRYKTFVETLSEWEDSRRQLFFRGQHLTATCTSCRPRLALSIPRPCSMPSIGCFPKPVRAIVVSPACAAKK